MHSSRVYLASSFVLFACFISSYTSGWCALDTEVLLKKMETAYAGVEDYQTRIELRTYRKDGSFETQKFLYSFKKPNWIRLDFESPHSGMVMVYPDRNGKVVIHPLGIARFLKLHLAPDNPLLKVPSGQRIDQTDLELLIRNISHSLTDQRRGPLEVTEDDGHIEIRVLALNHFREEIVTLYHFTIDKKLWLPVEVEESTPDGHLERTVTFQSLRLNINVPGSFFQLED